jgi:hypothetical protein
VQSQAEAEFPERMFIYCRRLIERYHRPVASFAVLADERPSWRPSEFGYNLWGCELRFRFPTVKLLDLRQRRAELEASTNLFASVVLAHLDTQATKDDPAKRKEFKFQLVRRLYDRNVPRKQVRLLFRVIDWLMKLTGPVAEEFREELRRFEQERKMPYVTSIEQLAKQEGVEEGREQGLEQGLVEGLHSGIESVLEVRFGPTAADLMPEIQAVHTPNRLRMILQAAKTSPSPDELRKLLRKAD